MISYILQSAPPQRDVRVLWVGRNLVTTTVSTNPALCWSKRQTLHPWVSHEHGVVSDRVIVEWKTPDILENDQGMTHPGTVLWNSRIGRCCSKGNCRVTVETPLFSQEIYVCEISVCNASSDAFVIYLGNLEALILQFDGPWCQHQ